MLIRTGLWSVEAAKAWLRNHDWGEAIASTLEDNPSPLRQTAWVTMVMEMEAVMCGSDGAPTEVGSDSGNLGESDNHVNPALPASLVE